MEQQSAFKSFELDVNQAIIDYLKETSKWSYILSILGFVGIGFMLIGALIMAISGGIANSGFDGAYGAGYAVGVAFVYVVLALVYLFPVLYLFRFSKNMKSALRLSNNQDFKKAFANLKSHYKFIGIFTIVVISLYALILIGAVVGASLF
ncbi:DUF5362 family protein [Meridianimaribacter flavus]|uniref:DUF5362 domain-containing protein n=1 Tax=Meridianimaribacter flavus TaxID=571115 RepID=A0ABY2G553_9FLAO|nr:DUF5362 family protein [Meridianimaribacter flavus]TDY11260.1 hypothetical protein A8975_1897 [Meridianimaribacter flavus]